MNISTIKDCYGCGVCSAACPKGIIKIGLNRKGFYEPRVTDEDKCTQCGACLDVCAFNHGEIALKDRNVKSWAAWSDDSEVRRDCSSGGLAYEIGRQLIAQGYKAAACRYNAERQRAEHYIAETVEELAASIGSKYMQSSTEDAFKAVGHKKTGERHLITGTPCQIDSFRRMAQKYRCEDRFVLMDILCHSVPSMHAWRNYLKMVEPKVGKVKRASWRNKEEHGWHDSSIVEIEGERGSHKGRLSQGDWFYTMFLGNRSIGSQCSKRCKYKCGSSSADIRVGDFWGQTYAKDEKGVSALMAFTDKGRQVVEALKGVTLVEHPLEVVTEGQMKSNARPAPIAPLVALLFRHNVYPSLRQWDLLFKIFDKPFRAVAKIRRILKH